MLAYLRIKNLAVIEELVLELGPGLTVFTGETGAGKSIILEGLALALGERAALDQVRAGADRALVEAAFIAPRDVALVDMLESSGLAAEDGGIVIRRVLTKSASRAYVNDQLVSQQKLKAIGERLVDLHGQHEHQSLLAVGAHRELLDRFAGLEEQRSAVATSFDDAVSVGEKLAAQEMDERDRAQRIDLMRFQVEEIDEADLRGGEDEELEAERRRLAHAEELVSLGRESMALLYEEEASAAALLLRAEQNLERLQELDPGSLAEIEAVRSARYAAEETARTLQRYVEGLNVDPDRLEQVDTRLTTLHRLERKYADSIEAIIEHGEKARRELEDLEQHDQRLEALQAQLDSARAAYTDADGELSEGRRRAAGELENQVLAELTHLGMESAQFDAAISPVRREAAHGLPEGATRWGTDHVEFKLTANPGEPPGALTKVASGGELSRVMLALKLTATDGDPLETMVFDEVDSGIGGGRIAEHLAQRLAALGESHQVLVVTHLPQVAAYANCHIGIRKNETVDGRVAVAAQGLLDDEQVDELARMLGGLEVTEATRQHAREMLASRR